MEDTKFVARLREKLAETDTLPSSQERVLIDARQFETWYLGTYGQEIDPEEIALTSVDLAEFKTFLLRSCQASTVERKFASLRAMLKLLDPVLLASVRMPKLPRSPKPAPSGFSRRERLAIFRAADKLSTRDRAIIYLAMWTGARSSSIADAKLSKVKIGPRSGSITYDTVKGKVDSYSVPLNAEAREALSAWIAERQPVKHDYLFTSERYPHEKLTRWTLHSIFHRRLASFVPAELRAKLKGLHQCRHSLGRMLAVEQNVDLPSVMQILNHTSLASVAIYTQPSERDLRKHLERAAGEEPEE